MDKQTADKIILEYIDKFYGFSLKKTCNIDKAEELAAKITFECYSSLLKSDRIHNINGYLYRIAENTFVKSVAINHQEISLDGITHESFMTDSTDFTNDLELAESYKLLRREIAYLSKFQRQIVIMHYYQKMKISEIAEKLNIPSGTVKWHLFDAKKSLKEGINIMRKASELSINPIEFCGMRHDGYAGKLGDTSDFLKKRITQNIAYAAYHQPKTINEIAETLNISPVFVEDEVTYLAEYGFMDELPGGKYRTNIHITEPTLETNIKQFEVLQNAADFLIENYIPQLMESIDDLAMQDNVYIPDNDINLLYWLLIPMAINQNIKIENENTDWDKFMVSRKDGGRFIAYATVMTDLKKQPWDERKYTCCGPMTRFANKYNFAAFQIDSFYDDRSGGWRNNLSSDYEYLYEFVGGKIGKEPQNIEKYQRLCEKGYLVDDKVNLIMIKLDNPKNQWTNYIEKVIAKPDECVYEYAKQISKQIIEILSPMYPEHMQELMKACNSANSIFSPRVSMMVMEKLIEQGKVKFPTDIQKHGLITIMFSDVLPK